MQIKWGKSENPSFVSRCSIKNLMLDFLFNIYKTRRAVVLLNICLLICAPLSCAAATLDEYRKNIADAKYLTIELLYPENEDMSAQESITFERDSLAQLRKLVPETEKVEWNETTLETDNSWLNENLSRYEKETEDYDKREQILNETYERLEAINTKLEELKNPLTETRSKDEDKQKLEEILSRDEFQKPTAKGESIFTKTIRKIIEWILSLFQNMGFAPKGLEDNSQTSFFLQIVIYAIVIGLLGFLTYRFAPFLAKHLRKTQKEEKKVRVILGERLAENETAQNLFNQAEQLAREGNLRGAIRKGYIALLCELSDRKIIGLAQHKTNRDYLRDVREKHALYENMNGLTSNFERHWYGFESADETDWEDFRQKYKKAVNN